MDQDYGGMVSASACSKCSSVSLQVAFLLVIDTLNTVFDIGLLWRYTITLFGELWVSFWFVFSALSYWHWQAATRISTILTGVSETSITCPSDDNNNHAFCSAVFSVGEYQMCAAGESDSDVAREFPHRTDYDGTSSLTYHSNLGSLWHAQTMISSTTQCFFGWRMVRLTSQPWMGWVIGISVFIQMGERSTPAKLELAHNFTIAAGLGATIGCFIVMHFAEFHKFKAVSSISMGRTQPTPYRNDRLSSCG
jgi:hypothetical protein